MEVTTELWWWPALLGQAALAGAVVLERATRRRSRGSVDEEIVAASSVSLLAIGTCLLVVLGVPRIGMGDGLMAMVAGALLFAHAVPYRRALDLDDDAVVQPMSQLVPVFVLAGAWVILRQQLPQHQVIGFVVVFAGAALFLHGELRGGWTVDQRTAVLMIGSSALLAAELVLLGHVLTRASLTEVLPLVVLGAGVAGVVMFAGSSRATQVFTVLDRRTWFRVAVGALMLVAGEALLVRALARGPVAAVAATSGFEAPFLLGIGVVAARVAPRLGDRGHGRPAAPTLVARVCALELLLGGLVLLVR
jgi:uncharacterized membrane protein